MAPRAEPVDALWGALAALAVIIMPLALAAVLLNRSSRRAGHKPDAD